MTTMNGTAYILNDRASALAAYPHARKINNLLYLSGVSSRKSDGTYVGVTKNSDGSVTLDIKSQARAVLENIELIMQESCNIDRRSLVDLTVFLLDMEDYSAFNEVYNAFFDQSTGPTRTTVAVKSLPNPNLLIEIKAIAYLP
ncbi:hypothetical protein HMI54_009562 [Coelomomyces lativittatus]|nr:hypothetical protein HMI56_002531 [Coelomomyces lativittatus]KAJ1515369.1 hypothetical protein HMI55_003768 [Coelomomyces lativittatus]KAJ1516415.1 hypothetical protein HMI54_009562 [Coelomomyces lativittatus]